MSARREAAEAIGGAPEAPRAVVEAVHPVLMSKDVDRALRFYARLGFATAFRDVAKETRYAVAVRDGAELHLQWHAADAWPAGQDRPTYRFLVVDVDALYAELAADRELAPSLASASPWRVPGDTPWGTREFHLRDPDGNGLQFYRPLAARG